MTDEKDTKPPADPSGETASKTANISLGGMCLLTEKRLPVGTLLRLHIYLAGVPLSTKAKVVWSNAAGAGICFFNMKDSDVRALKEYLLQVGEKLE
jgi:hypothetical protein